MALGKPLPGLNMLNWHASSSVQLLIIILYYIVNLNHQYQSYQVNGQTPVVVAADQTNKTLAIKIVVPNLDPNHYRFWLKNHPIAFKEFEKICSQLTNNSPMGIENLNHFQSIHSSLSIEDPRYLKDLDYGKKILNTICSKLDIVTKSCWGYENNCQLIYLMPECHHPSSVSSKDEQEKKIAWFSQADFGYILERRREMQRYCSPDKSSNDTWISSFECTKYFRTCRGQNLFMKFDNIPKNETNLITMPHRAQYQMGKGNIGGLNCDLQLKRIQEEGGQEGPLRSWFNELKNYNIISQPPGAGQKCDITIDKQAFIIKLDSTSNMYHYFCNFLNLYATIHLNNKFSDDNQIIIWDNHLPRGPFELMWQAFTRNPLRHIGEFDGKRVCFKKFIFTLLPRMADGLYYNTQLVSGCSKTGLFDAFNKHIIHKLNVTQDEILKSPELISLTIVKRSVPLYRRLVNELELEKAIRERFEPYFKVQLVDYATLKFDEQLKISRNTDILVGIHGAGLTNLLFLPDWATLIELHDCDDASYKDLARLRGVKYAGVPGNGENFVEKVQVENRVELERSGLVDNEKFLNYRVSDIDKFLVLLEKVAERVKMDKSKYSRNSMKASEPPKVDLKIDGRGSVVNKEHATTTTTAKPHIEL